METGEELKSCCAALYEKDWVRLLLGNSYHPGGLALTERLGQLLSLRPGMRILTWRQDAERAPCTWHRRLTVTWSEPISARR